MEPIYRITFMDGSTEELDFNIPYNGGTGMSAVDLVIRALIGRIKLLEKELENERNR